MRADEIFVIEALAKRYSCNWIPGANPPDAHLICGAVKIAVEISTLTQHVTDDRGHRPRLSDDKAVDAAVKKLKGRLQPLIPSGYTIVLTLSAPVSDLRNTMAALAIILIDRITALRGANKQRLQINGNKIDVTYAYRPGKEPTICAVFPHRASDPDIALNARGILEETIGVKTQKCAQLSAPLWLALFNDYWLADEATYKRAFASINAPHPFDKILIVRGDGSTYEIF